MVALSLVSSLSLAGVLIHHCVWPTQQCLDLKLSHWINTRWDWLSLSSFRGWQNEYQLAGMIEPLEYHVLEWRPIQDCAQLPRKLLQQHWCSVQSMVPMDLDFGFYFLFLFWYIQFLSLVCLSHLSRGFCEAHQMWVHDFKQRVNHTGKLSNPY